jgi:hypothetical protein
LEKLLRIVFSGRALSMNIASAPGFLSCQFETEILLSENTFVFLHDQDPLQNRVLHRSSAKSAQQDDGNIG